MTIEHTRPVRVTTPRDNLRGMALMLVAFFIFAGADAMAKYLTQTVHPMQIVWVRQLGLFVPVIGLLLWRGRGLLKTEHWKPQVTRGVLAGCSAACFITGVGYVPLATAISITFMAPFIVTVLSAVILKEPVGVHRWSAVIVGFLGALIVIRPGEGSFHPAMLLIVLAAFAFALRQILSRVLSASDRTITTVAYTGLFSFGVLSIPLPFFWAWPESGGIVLLLLALAVCAGIGEFLLIKALEIGQAAVLAPSQYSMLLWGSVYGWVIFQQWPDALTWLGALIIVASGLYTANRERIAARRWQG